MSERVLPERVRQSLESSASGDADIMFVTITHPELDGSIRLARDGADYLVDGETFHQSWFEIDILSDTDGPPKSRFRFPNVDRTAITMLREVVGPAIVAFDLYSSAWFDLSANPRTVKPGETLVATYSASNLFLTDITITPAEVSGTLRSWDYRQESWPDMLVSQEVFPGVWVR